MRNQFKKGIFMMVAIIVLTLHLSYFTSQTEAKSYSCEYDQSNFRFKNDFDILNSTISGTSKELAGVSLIDYDVGSFFRLRFQLIETIRTCTLNTITTPVLEYKVGGSCTDTSGWTTVPTQSGCGSSPVCQGDSAHYTDGELTTSVLSSGLIYEGGDGVEIDGSADTVNSWNEDEAAAEWEYYLILTSNATYATAYTLRLAYGSNTGFEAYTTCPTITTPLTAPVLTQRSYQWLNDDGYPDANNNTDYNPSTGDDTAVVDVEIGQLQDIRIQIDNTGGSFQSKDLGLQFCDYTNDLCNEEVDWSNVDSLTAISYYGSVTDASNSILTSAKAAANSNTWVNGVWAGWYNYVNIDLAQDYYSEYSFTIDTAQANESTEYRLRLYDTFKSSPLDGYTSYPTLTTVSSSTVRYAFNMDRLINISQGVEEDLEIYLGHLQYLAVSDNIDGTRFFLEYNTTTDYIQIFHAVKKNINNTDDININWNGQFSIAPATQIVSLYVYRAGSTNDWELLDSNDLAAADVDIDLTATISTNLSEYYQTDNWVHFRIYQSNGDIDGIFAMRTDQIDIDFGSAGLAFSSNPVESVPSADGVGAGDTSGNPTNEGTSLGFAATATGATWKLLICKTDGIIGIDCDGGASDRWCVSGTAVGSGVENTCTYTTTGSEASSNAWYAYACDASTCSAVSQGSGDSGSPFIVNHDPGFSAYSDDTGAGIDPGTTATFSTTTLDSDISDTMTLYVCKTASFTGGASPTCSGGEWCHDTTPTTGSPSCTYAIPSVNPDGNYNTYGYLVDNHGLVSSSATQGTDSTMTVNNTTPSVAVGDILIYDTDGSGDLTLTVEEGETTDFYVTFIVTDTNSCEILGGGDEISSAILNIYRSGVGQAACDTDGEDDNNNCYANAHTGTGGQCVQDISVDACTGSTDSTVGWKCEFPLQYHTDPTDVGSPYSAQNWKASIQVTDDDSSASALTEGDGSKEMLTFLAYDVDNGSSSLNYGEINPEEASGDIITNIRATGNSALDINVRTSQANALCSDYPTCSAYTMANSYQHVDETADTAYASMSVSVSTTPQRVEVNIQKNTITGTITSADAYWKLQVPFGQYATSYTGINIIEGVAAN